MIKYTDNAHKTNTCNLDVTKKGTSNKVALVKFIFNFNVWKGAWRQVAWISQ